MVARAIVRVIIMPPEETFPMPPPSDDRPGEPVSPDPPAAAPAEAAESAPAEPLPQGEGPQGEGPQGGEPRRRRRRRRRRPPREASAETVAAAGELSPPTIEPAADPPGNSAAPGMIEVRDRPRRRRRRRPPLGASPTPAGDDPVSSGEGMASPEATPGDAEPGAQSRGSTLRLPFRPRRQPRWPVRRTAAAAAPTEIAPTETAPMGTALAAGDAPDGAPRPPRPDGERPRRRRRRSPHAGESVTAQEGQPEAGRGTEPNRGRQRFGPRRGDAGEARSRQPGAPQPRLPGEAPREPRAPGAERRDRDDAGPRGRSGGGTRDGQRGRGRDAPPRRAEQKLYALESMVDRGFEDVADEAEDSGSRRVHWTIVKRTVADQKSGKPMSAAYVLQRDGAETEFPNLGAARAAANKTIVHPEKLTLSKAEHAAAKNK